VALGRVLAAQFSAGLDASTINDTGTDGQFLLGWLTPVVQQLTPRTVLARIDAQLTPDSLLQPLEFSIVGR